MNPLLTPSHPKLHLGAFVTRFPAALGDCAPSAQVERFLSREPSLGQPAPVAANDVLRQAVRELLRYGGFKPSGRSKPASEYLERAAANGPLPAINPAVDTCNAVSLHSGIPISVVDLERTRAPLKLAIAEAGTTYVFNATGQTIDCAGLLCLHDAEGACANAVKDSQRTKTHPGTTTTLSLLWGPASHAEHVEQTCSWYRSLLATYGAATETLPMIVAA